MIGWSGFFAVLGAFFVTHSIPVRPNVKAGLQTFLGQRGFTACYSALSLIMLATLIWAAQSAPVVELWPQAVWHRYVIFAGMLLVCLIAGLAIGQPNPFSFGGSNTHKFDPTRPGIVRLTRHPMLLVLMLWSGLHLLPNGDLAHIIMFGIFFAFAFIGRWIIDCRNKRLMGEDLWQSLLEETNQSPVFSGFVSTRSFMVRLGLAVLVFAVLLILHAPIIGVSPLPL
jgi:uncharacterized membrane protein